METQPTALRICITRNNIYIYMGYTWAIGTSTPFPSRINNTIRVNIGSIAFITATGFLLNPVLLIQTPFGTPIPRIPKHEAIFPLTCFFFKLHPYIHIQVGLPGHHDIHNQLPETAGSARNLNDLVHLGHFVPNLQAYVLLSQKTSTQRQIRFSPPPAPEAGEKKGGICQADHWSKWANLLQIPLHTSHCFDLFWATPVTPHHAIGNRRQTARNPENFDAALFLRCPCPGAGWTNAAGVWFSPAESMAGVILFLS